jgi:hypothetical protein
MKNLSMTSLKCTVNYSSDYNLPTVQFLGSVEISLKPLECCDEMQESCKIPFQFIKAGEDTSIMF